MGEVGSSLCEMGSPGRVFQQEDGLVSLRLKHCFRLAVLRPDGVELGQQLRAERR